MFRYLGLVWDPADAAATAVARTLGQAVRLDSHWQPVLHRSGADVFVRGAQGRANIAQPLRTNGGVVLGKVFRRYRDGRPSPLDHPLSRAELDGIFATGGTSLIDNHWGRYVAFLARQGGGMWVMRDPGGALPCFRLDHANVTIVFSWLEDALALPGVPVPSVSWDRLVAHIALVSLSGRETVLEGIHQVLPGERFSIAPGAEPPALLWDAARIAGAPIDLAPPVAARELREIVRGTVQCWAGCYDPILLRLSGGLDSAIVLSCLSSTVVADVKCLNYHSPGSNSDERSYARLAAEGARRPMIERERDNDISLEHAFDVARTPWPHNYIGRLGTSHTDAAIAREIGATAMFTGGDGDQLFFEFREWWGAADYLRLRGFDTGFLPTAMEAARLSGLSIWRTLGLAFRDRLGRPEPLRGTETYLTLASQEAIPPAQTLARYTHPALQSAGNLPLGKRIHLQQLLYPTDNYDPYEREAAPELVNPLMSQPVIERCLATPIYQLTQGGRGRGLVRAAFANDLPEQIVRRRSKGGMEEHVTGILRRNLDLARQTLNDGQLVAKGFLDRAKLEIALSGRPSAQAAHTVEIHMYLAIEAWLQRMSASGS